MRKTLFLTSVLLLIAGSLSAQQASLGSRIKINGYAQVYAEAATNMDKVINDTFGINKIEVMATGQITDKWSMGITVQFNKPVMLKDLYMQYAIMPELRIKVGQFKTPFSHENQVAPFINPLAIGGSMPTIYFAGVGMHPLYYGTAGRDLGIELSGDLFKSLLSYKLVALNGQGMNELDINKRKLMGGSLYIRPIDGLRLHTSYLGGKQVAMGNGLGISQGSSYTGHRASAGVIADYQLISVATEYMYGKDGNTEAMGAYLTAAIHLPKRYDIVVGGDYLQTNMKEKGALCTATLGVEKWFAGKCRLQVQYRYAHKAEGMLVGPAGYFLRTQLQVVF